MSPNKKAQERLALRLSGKRHEWYAKALSGSDEIGAPLERCVAG
jgi:hypothetical protein